MSTTLTDNTIIFNGPEEDGFELPTNSGVWVRPLLRTDDGATVDVFHMTLLASAQISPENHPYSETLIVISGELSCMIDDLVPAVIGAGNAIHIGANRCHNIINPTTGPAEVAMLIGA